MWKWQSSQTPHIQPVAHHVIATQLLMQRGDHFLMAATSADARAAAAAAGASRVCLNALTAGEGIPARD